eukprot:c14369_g1_i1.p1 GENE.c14369_g1_i1~~c14369_g1_i1.p1  ORF type:complete len:218 (+),score=21.51 c14369_g1_i1:270-923(+)
MRLPRLVELSNWFTRRLHLIRQHFVKEMSETHLTVTLAEIRKQRTPPASPENVTIPNSTTVDIPGPSPRNHVLIRTPSTRSQDLSIHPLPKTSMAIKVALAVSLIFVCQGFIFMKCGRAHRCNCSPHTFADSSSCALMCACQSMGCRQTTTLQDDWEFACDLTNYTSWEAYKSPLCWRGDGQFSCRSDFSSILSLIGSVVLIPLAIKMVFSFICCLS